MGIAQKVKEYVGKKATVNLMGLTVEVIISDYKVSWGNERFLVKPVAGDKEIWVQTVRLID